MITQRNNPAIASVLGEFIIKGGTRTLQKEIEKKEHTEYLKKFGNFEGQPESN